MELLFNTFLPTAYDMCSCMGSVGGKDSFYPGSLPRDLPEIETVSRDVIEEDASIY